MSLEKDLEKCRNKPFYYVHFPSIGYGALLTLIGMLANG